MRRGVLTFFCFGLTIWGGLFANKAVAATRTVDNTSDNGSLTACTPAPNDCSLRGAVAASALTDDIINFDSVVFGSPQIIQLTSDLVINKSLKIFGPGRDLLTISGTGAAFSSVLQLQPHPNNQTSIIEISDLKITNGGSGLFCSVSNVWLTRMIFMNNADSGIVVGYHCYPRIYDSIISNNSAFDGGGIEIAPQVAPSDNSHTFIYRSAIINNTASNDGGGIYNAGQLSIYDSTVSGNTAGRYGGGIYARGNLQGPAGGYIHYSTITNNQAGNRGGGIYSFNDRRVVLSNNIIAGNTNPGNTFPDIANGFHSEGYNVVGNDEGSSGYIETDRTDIDPQLGPLADNGGLTPTHAIQCTSPAVDNGNPKTSSSIDQRGGVRPANGLPDIGAYEINCVRNDNNNGNGSIRQAIADAPNGGTIYFDPIFFNQPRAIALGGSAIDSPKNLTISGPGANNLTIDGENLSRIFNINAITLNLRDLRLARGNPGTGADGGAIFVNNDGTLNASSIVISDSRANWGGGIFVAGKLNLTNSTISNCTANLRGGAIWNDPQGIVNATGSTISGNHVDDRGGGIGNSGTITIKTSTISGNTALRPAGSGGAPIGGGIYNDGVLRMDESTLAGNTAQHGGGLFNKRYLLDGFGEIRNSTIVNNSAVQTGNDAEANGGAIYADSNHTGGWTSTVDLRSVTLYGNSAGSNGGGIYMFQYPGNNPLLNLDNSIVANNTASFAPDMRGEIISYGYNLITSTDGSYWAPYSPSLEGNIINPPGGVILAPLGNYGGPTPTMALLPGSPAINNGIPNSLLTDQRGVSRPIGGRADIGAFENNIVFEQTSLPYGYMNSFFSQQLSATRLMSLAEKAGSSPTENMVPAQFEIVPIAGQSLPPGITLSPTGLLSGTPTEQGEYIFTVKAADTDGIAGVSQFTIQVLAPTAAGVLISGRIMTASGSGIKNALVTLTDLNGNTRTALTNTFGRYLFDDIEVGETYVVGVASKQFTFTPQIVSITSDITELDFIADE